MTPGYKVLKAIRDRGYYVMDPQEERSIDNSEAAGIIDQESGIQDLERMLTIYMTMCPAYRAVREVVNRHCLGFNAWFCTCIELADREARKEGYRNSVDRAFKLSESACDSKGIYV